MKAFYTNSQTVQTCLTTMATLYSWDHWRLIVDPSAGGGAFFLSIPSRKKIGLDINPTHKQIKQQNFFAFTPKTSGPILVIGNPPFQSYCSLKFFNHAALWADVIAFILPRSYRRISMQNKLNSHFHLIRDITIPTSRHTFTPPTMVKCCFQVWIRRKQMRAKIPISPTINDWKFIKIKIDKQGQPIIPTNADFALRGFGSHCGEIKTKDFHQLRPYSWHWIKCTSIPKQELIRRFNALDYSVSEQSARQCSLGKGELVRLYSLRKKKFF